MLVAPPAVAEDSEGFSADDFLSKYNLLLNENNKGATDKSLEVKLNSGTAQSTGAKDPELVYFKTESLNNGTGTSLSLMPTGKTLSTFTARKSTLTGTLENIVLPAGETFLLNSFTPRYSQAEISFGFGGKKGLEDGEKSAFDVSLSSQVSNRSGDAFSANNPYVVEALNSRIYDFGLNVGYSGFQFGATVRGEEGAYYDGLSGYDVGLSYNRPTWSTSILFGEYRQGNGLLISTLDSPYLDNRYFALEFGAAYKLSPGLQVVGSFRFYEDPNLFTLNPDKIGTTQLFYLGTRVNF